MLAEPRALREQLVVVQWSAVKSDGRSIQTDRIALANGFEGRFIVLGVLAYTLAPSLRATSCQRQEENAPDDHAVHGHAE